LKQKWEALNLDALICPVSYHSAYKSKDAEDLGVTVDYLTIWNVVHYPVGVVPVTEVMEGEDAESYKDDYSDYLTSKIKESIRDSSGMPIGVQVVAPKWKDEECIAVMKILDSEVKFRKRPTNV